jgi:hypothetical protein
MAVTEPVYLPSQHASIHDLPDDAERLAAELATAVRNALLYQQPDGNFEDAAADDDIGDMGLGVLSLLCLAWKRGERRDEELVAAARRGADYFLRERVYRSDNPGEPFLRVRNSGEPYARYMPGAGEHPFGDWPSTVWAMLHAVNVLELGEGLLTSEQYTQVGELATGYWRWLTEVSLFNPQQTANQAIGAIAGGLMLGRHLRAAGRAEQGEQITADALRLYAEEIRAARVIDRGYALPLEHGAGHDQNYVPISLTFLAQAYRVSGEKCFLEDGEQIARHLDARLSARGFDYGGPRYSEQHSGAEGMLGLRVFSSRIRADLGRYLADRRVAYYPLASTGAPSGHFAFASVWFWQDDSHQWYRDAAGAQGTDARCTPYSVRGKAASVSYTGNLTPYLIDAAGTSVIESIADYQHGIGPVVLYPDGRTLLMTRPLGPLRVCDVVDGGFAAKLVTKAVVTREQVMISVQQLAVCDEEHVYIVAVLDRSGLPDEAEVSFLAGLPYVEDVDGRQRKIVSVREPGGEPFDLGVAGAVLDTAGVLRAGGMSLRSAGGLRVVSPPEGDTYFSSPQTIGLTQERAAFALADDPRGYGDPDSGWRRVAGTNLVLAEPVEVAGSDLVVCVVCYGPEDDVPLAVTAEASEDGVTVRTADFTAFIGHPAGDAHGEPVVRLSETRGNSDVRLSETTGETDVRLSETTGETDVRLSETTGETDVRLSETTGETDVRPSETE